MKKYWRRARFAGWVLNNSPFSRCVILNGSYASGNANQGSDIDILLVAKSGRIFTARFFAVLLMSLLGIKRSNNCSADHAGKVCLNYYLTENFLKIPEDRGYKIDRYCAKNYSKAKFLSGDYRLFEKFMKTNEGLFIKYLSVIARNAMTKQSIKKIATPYGLAMTKPISRFSPLKTFRECILSGKFGDRVESKLKSLQIRRIEENPITKKYPELIVYNDRELRFHPPKTVESVK